MSPKQRKAYEEMEEGALVELEDSFLKGEMPAVNAMRCRQIMSHPETFGIGKGERTGKDERLIIHLADAVQSGEPIAVFASLIPEQERIVELARSMGLRTALINGNVSSAARARIDQAFRAGQLDCVVASPDTAGVGFNWHHLLVMVFASLNYMDDSFVQAYRRGIRGKREKALLIYVLEYRDSIDQRIMQIIEEKSREANLVDPTKEVFSLSEQRKQEAVEMFDKSKATARKISMADFTN
jgi:superfamily II DNA/RNA helicase